MATVLVTGSFDDFRSRDVRLLEEAAKLGSVHIGLWTDELVRARDERPPKFPFAERLYVLEAIRHVTRVHPVNDFSPADPPGTQGMVRPDVWVAAERDDSPGQRAWAESRGLERRVLASALLESIPPAIPLAVDVQAERKRVLVTGCFDWFHSGHVRFFEEASEVGDLYVGIGSDASLSRLKGPGHPLFPESVRAFMVQSVRYVKRAFIATGQDWLDAEPEMAVLKPHAYVVNDDGDRPEKREFCRATGIEYVVLERRPRPGLPRRTSSDLRGF
jgi:cytidyltransferase-like protein